MVPTSAEFESSKKQPESQEATVVLKGRKIDKLRQDVADLRKRRKNRRFISMLGWTAGGAIACSLGMLGAVKLQPSASTEAAPIRKAPESESSASNMTASGKGTSKKHANQSSLGAESAGQGSVRLGARSSEQARHSVSKRTAQDSARKVPSQSKHEKAQASSSKEEIEVVSFDDVAD